MSHPPGQSLALIEALCSDDGVVSEAAAARLAITGLPAVRHLLKALDTASARDRVRMLGVLERIGAASARPRLVEALHDPDDDVAGAAAAALGSLLTSPDSDTAAATLDHLAATALDATRAVAVRLAAIGALQQVDDIDAIAMVRAQLLADTEPLMRTAARGDGPPVEDTGRPSQQDSDEQPPLERLEAAATGTLPDDPTSLRQAVAATAGTASLTTLHRLIERMREHEATRPPNARDWQATRAAVHQALADRGSRTAVYDLRDTVAHLGASTPVGVLSALQRIGDTPTLDVLADAWRGTDDEWFRKQLASTFHAIVSREGLTRRHAAVRRLGQRVPEAFDALWPTAVSTPSRNRPSRRQDAP